MVGGAKPPTTAIGAGGRTSQLASFESCDSSPGSGRMASVFCWISNCCAPTTKDGINIKAPSRQTRLTAAVEMHRLLDEEEPILLRCGRKESSRGFNTEREMRSRRNDTSRSYAPTNRNGCVYGSYAPWAHPSRLPSHMFHSDISFYRHDGETGRTLFVQCVESDR